MDVRTLNRTIDDDYAAKYNGVIDYSFSAESAALPFTLAQAKTWARVDTDEDDALITALITAARRKCEQFTGISFITRTVTAILNNSNGGIYLPYGPVAGTIALTDLNGNTITQTNNEIIGLDFKQIVEPRSSYIKAVYPAGYTTLPADLVTAWKMQVAYMYDHRGDGEGKNLSPEALVILETLRRVV
jgi:hypothetical protein